MKAKEASNMHEFSERCLEPQNDGLPMRASGLWAREKLDYLERYVGVFITSMRKKPWRAIHYIDLFAGPGKCRSETGEVYLGSPLIALQTAQPFDRYFYVDLDEQNITALKQRCAASSLQDRG
jgi:three-Cys-motif partner protein